HQRHVLAIAVVVVVGDVAGVAVPHGAGGVRVAIPDRFALAVGVPRALDLVGGRRRAPLEAGRESPASALAHVRSRGRAATRTQGGRRQGPRTRRRNQVPPAEPGFVRIHVDLLSISSRYSFGSTLRGANRPRVGEPVKRTRATSRVGPGRL